MLVFACYFDILSLAASKVSKILDVLVTEGNTFDVKSDTSVDEIIQYFNKKGVYYEAACRMMFMMIYSMCLIIIVYCSTVNCNTVHFRISFPSQSCRHLSLCHVLDPTIHKQLPALFPRKCGQSATRHTARATA